jgi:hypothetical protein
VTRFLKLLVLICLLYALDETSAWSDSPDSQPSQASQPAHQNSSPNIFRRWFAMGEKTQREQPDWLSPLATTSGRIKQEFRYDVFHQPAPGGSTDYNFGGGKGLEFIVAPRLQLLIGPPPFIAHTSSAPNGFGDIPLMAKFRIAAAAPKEGNYLLTLLFNATVPGGASATKDAVLSPGIAAGKGWGNFDVQTTLSGNLPTGDLATIGRQLLSNTAFQYRILGKLYPEVEVNSTFFLAGKNSGETQVFLTPGLGFGRIRVWRALKISAAGGMQIAATAFHTYNHRAILSIRYSF